MSSEWKKDGERIRSSICGKSVTEGNNLLSRTFVARERITVWSGTGDQYAADHSKWSLPVVMWADGI